MRSHGHRANKDKQNKGKTVNPSQACISIVTIREWVPPALQDEEDEHMPGAYFYGFKVGGKVADNLVKFSLAQRHRVPRATWTDDSKLHVTVKFVGKSLPPNTDEEFQRVCAQASKFQLEVAGAGVFNNRSGPRVLFANMGKGEQHIKLLNEELGGTQHFTPHLTIAKLEDLGDAEAEFLQLQKELTGVSFGTCLVDELAIYQTQGDGKPYKVVAWHRLLG